MTNQSSWGSPSDDREEPRGPVSIPSESERVEILESLEVDDEFEDLVSNDGPDVEEEVEEDLFR